MATFREIVYSVLDLLKETSDDAFYTEEHVLFLVTKMRALLLERKYRQTRNSSFMPMNDQNTQQICLNMEKTSLPTPTCAEGWLKSTQKIPKMLDISAIAVYPVSNLLSSTISFIPAERMPYVGHNKWLRNIIYCARGGDGYLYMHGNNPQFLYLEKTRLEGVFADPEEAAALACTEEGESVGCEVLDQEFPLEEALIPSCIEMVVQELNGSRYAPKDNRNNAHDDLGDASLNSRQAAPATRRRRRDEEDS